MWYVVCGMRAQFSFGGGKNSAQLIQLYLKRLSDPVHRNRWGQAG